MSLTLALIAEYKMSLRKIQSFICFDDEKLKTVSIPDFITKKININLERLNSRYFFDFF